MFAHPKTRLDPTEIAPDTFLVHDHQGEGEGPVSVGLNTMVDLSHRLESRVERGRSQHGSEGSERIGTRCLRPAGTAWLRPRWGEVRLAAGCTVRDARPTGDGVSLRYPEGWTQRRLASGVSST